MRAWRAPALTIEGIQSGDGRVISPMAVEWADLPLPLAWLRDGDQHADMTEMCPQIGIIESMSREGQSIPGAGQIDDENPDGLEVIRRMEAGTAPLGNRFPVSIDPDNWEVQIVATESEDEEGVILMACAGRGPLNAGSVRETVRAALLAAAGDPDPGEDGGPDGVVLFEDTVDAILERYVRLRVRGATLCSVAAFDGAWIELEAADAEPTGDPVEPVAAALAIPARPPSWWFDVQLGGRMAEPTAGDDRLIEQIDGGWAVPLTITDDGQVFGHIARRDQAHRGYAGRHVPPPTSATNYREFHVGSVVCEDGTHVATGAMTVGCDHAPESMALLAARDFYAHSGMGWCDGRITDGEFGPWFAGALRPGLTDDDVRVLRALAPSGDWRPQNGSLEMCAVLAVNVPGFPIARESLAASALPHPAPALAAARVGLDAEGGLSSLVAAGMVTRCGECAERERQRAAESGQERVLALMAALESSISEAKLAVARIERRTRHLEPIAASALAERVHNGSR